MSDLIEQLAASSVALDIASSAMVERLGLGMDQFAWVRAKQEFPMETQQLLLSQLDFNEVRGTYENSLSFYGGQTLTARTVNWSGRIEGELTELAPFGTKHQAGNYTLPVPYILRKFSVIDGIAMVETPTVERPTTGEAWYITEGIYELLFRERTSFNAASGGAYIHNGTLPGLHTDHTKRIPITEVPEEIAEPRLETLCRALATAATIFDEVGSPINRTVTWEVFIDH